MTKLKKALCALFLATLTGCFQTKDELTINADGSGKVRIESRIASGAGMAAASLGGEGILAYPPLNPAEAKKFFPGKDFTVTTKQTNAENGDTVTIVDVTYKDINALLASPYGRAHQLTVALAPDGLVVKGITAMEAVARMAEIKQGNGNEEMDMAMAMSGMGGGDLKKRVNEMRSEFRITLPNPITTTGAHDGKTATWAIERAKAKDADDFAQQLGAVAEVRCAADGVKFTPVTPARLAAQPFEQLAPGAAASSGPALDTAKITAAAKFVPYSVSVTRAVDLSGKGGIGESTAQLTGAVVLPPEFAPQKWGEPALQEAVDAKGNDLKPKPSPDGEFRGGMRNFDESDAPVADDDEATNTASDLRHTVTFSFRPPDWKIKSIGRIKGSVSLQYFSGAEVVKLTNAIPAKWIMTQEQVMGGGMDMSEKPLHSPRLAELGLEMTLQNAMSESGATVLELQMKSSKGAVMDAQVYDANGKPWPTFQSQNVQGMGESCQITVIGSPKPPLSLAFTASGSGSSVEVPVMVENVPLGAK